MGQSPLLVTSKILFEVLQALPLSGAVEAHPDGQVEVVVAVAGAGRPAADGGELEIVDCGFLIVD
jgi:hypothetical protein